MDQKDFIKSLSENNPPQKSNKFLNILWYDGKGKWDIAHNIAQSIYSREGSLLHAYLHRKEGDLTNAAYWYSNADQEMPNISIIQEWESLVQKFINY